MAATACRKKVKMFKDTGSNTDLDVQCDSPSFVARDRIALKHLYIVFCNHFQRFLQRCFEAY